MRAASTPLRDFLYSRQGFVFADLYTLTLLGGAVTRWTNAGQLVNANGHSYTIGPPISDSGVRMSRGVQVDTIDITIMADTTIQMGGVSLMTFIRQGGLDQANLTIERAFQTDWSTMFTTGPVGTMIRYSGRVTDVKVSRAQAVVTVASWMELLDTYMPVDVYSASCLNTVFDTHCTLNRASYAATSTALSGSTQTLLATGLGQAADYFSLGTVQFTSGANAGIRRTVKSHDGAGHLSLVSPFPSAPAAGDALVAYPGCDLSQGTCTVKFNNLINFRGQPYIPAPETAL